MGKRLSKVLIILAVLMFTLTGSVFAKSNVRFIEPEYTDAYKAWLELSDEERKNVLEPPKYAFYTGKTNEENAMQNEKIQLKNLMKMLKGTSYDSEPRFSLKSIIPNNVVIRDQQDTNWCWSFASLSSLETNLALKNYANKVAEKIYDYSEKHQAYSMTSSFLEGQVNQKGYSSKVSDGGTMVMATAYLTRGTGVVDEEDMPFVNSEEPIDINSIDGKEVQTTVDDIKFFNGLYVTKNGAVHLDGTEATNNEFEDIKTQIKEHISTNGSVDAGTYFPALDDTTGMNLKEGTLYTSFDSYSDIKSEKYKGKNAKLPNHAISIIGWDDDFDKSKFINMPKENGAWIVRNSWGETSEIDITETKTKYPNMTAEEIKAAFEDHYNFNSTLSEDGNSLIVKLGDNGIFYISYEDAYIYTSAMGIENANDTLTYDNIYQYDELGGSITGAIPNSERYDTYLANVFHRTADNMEYLKSIGLSNLKDGKYEVYVNPNGTEKTTDKLKKATLTTGSDITLSAGYHTIELAKPFELTGENFVIVIKAIHNGKDLAYFSLEDPSSNQNIVTSNAGESFLKSEESNSDYSNWIDISNPNGGDNYLGNLCIKGITINEYTGEVANNDNPEDNPSDENTTNTTNTINETNTTNTVNETNTTNTTNDTNTTDETVTTLPKNSTFDEASATITTMYISTDSAELTFEVRGIEVDELMDSYEHYFYITSNPNATNIADLKWTKVESFKKQADGTYTLTFKVTDESQVADVEENKDAYVYIKEIATKGNEKSTLISNAMKININTSNLDIDLDIDDKDNNGGKTATYTPAEETKSKSSQDTTTAKVATLPKTGVKTILVIIGAMAIIFVVSYIKYKNLNDVK